MSDALPTLSTTMVVHVFKGTPQERAAAIKQLKRLTSKLGHVAIAYEADFEGIPKVHAEDNHGHFNDFR